LLALAGPNEIGNGNANGKLGKTAMPETG